jgi:hypothetical protein
LKECHQTAFKVVFLLTFPYNLRGG